MAGDDAQSGRASRWLEYLPAIYQEGASGGPTFLGRFLLAFQEVLHGTGDEPDGGLAAVVSGIPRHFRPQEAPAEFLEWLAGWVALTLRVDFDEQRRRDFVENAVRLYRLRGTRRGLEEMIRIYTGILPTINETMDPLRVGTSSQVGASTVIGGGAPHFFRVTVRISTPDPAVRRRMYATVQAIVDAEKPAHTRYALVLETPSLQIGVHSRLGEDTLLSPPFAD
jgi:phage tail-like protein